MIQRLRFASLAAVSGFLLFVAAWSPHLAKGQDAVLAEPAAGEVEMKVEKELIENPMESKLVQVDWIEEMFEGGLTMVALAILSVGMLAFLLERFFTLRSGKFMPPALLKEVRPMFHERRYDDILAACKKHPSTASEIIRHLVEFRGTNFDVLQSGAADIGARAVLDQEEKCNPLSVIAGIAPLLGLLGTMIGMIEAFKLVEVFGDEGGASLLAGSISKALITTAVGLILAIPALLGYHWSRRRVHTIAGSIEIESESLLKDWFLSRK
ncbi:MotA/TolQ/ExbB proton channel family protein [Luteolibacter marinus]|uniref:MotA/TolQ/ExbB proton channel family protein n=1 Tax=Luteolibacter marinus TaxID=2776705 RepID=UPI00186814C9|nr:MotA/TolQ/ExbB proton channel family protein [Luteolibacter marinus]